MTVFCDLETFSTVPIKHGVHAYAVEAEIMIFAYAIDDGPVHVWDVTLGEPMPDELREALKGHQVWHNAAFDRTVLRHAWGFDNPVSLIDDTMVIALQHSLPGALGKLCDVFNIPVDKAKDKDGKRLILLFCTPRPKKQKLRRATRETHPEDWAQFLDYARLDIEAMRAIYKKLPRWNDERALWALDQKINDRGVAVDVELAHAAVRAVEREKGELADQAQDLTYGAVSSATKRDELLRFILAAHDLELPDLKASTIEKLLEEDIPSELRELLLVRLQASTASVAKYKALLRAVSPDGRLRGTLQFCGASRTGRFAGRIFQAQNLMRPTMPQEMIELAIEAFKAGVGDLVFG